MHAARRAGVLGSAALLVSSLFVATPAYANDINWEDSVKRIPSAKYTKDAPAYLREAAERVRPYLSDKAVRTTLQPVLDDLDTRYFDGARLKSQADQRETVKHLEPWIELLEDEAEDRQPFADSLVGTLTAVRLLADAARHRPHRPGGARPSTT